jgi:hypothetical protein
MKKRPFFFTFHFIILLPFKRAVKRTYLLVFYYYVPWENNLITLTYLKWDNRYEQNSTGNPWKPNNWFCLALYEKYKICFDFQFVDWMTYGMENCYQGNNKDFILHSYFTFSKLHCPFYGHTERSNEQYTNTSFQNKIHGDCSNNLYFYYVPWENNLITLTYLKWDNRYEQNSTGNTFFSDIWSFQCLRKASFQVNY